MNIIHPLPKTLKPSAALWPQVVLRRWPLLLGTSLIVALFQIYFAVIGANVGHSSTGELITRLGDWSVSMFSSVVLLFVVPLTVIDIEQGRKNSNVWKFSHDRTLPLINESLRVATSMIWWLFALIIPSVIKGFHYYFVPFLVMFHPEYEKKEFDALKVSTKIVKPIFIPLIIFLVSSAIIEPIFSFWPHLFSGAAQHVSRFIVAPLTLIFNVYILLVCFHLYREALKMALEADH